jgi:hypothetical protein
VLAALDSITTAAYDSTANHDAAKRSEWQESPVIGLAGGAFSFGSVGRARSREVWRQCRILGVPVTKRNATRSLELD